MFLSHVSLGPLVFFQVFQGRNVKKKKTPMSRLKIKFGLLESIIKNLIETRIKANNATSFIVFTNILMY